MASSPGNARSGSVLAVVAGGVVLLLAVVGGRLACTGFDDLRRFAQLGLMKAKIERGEALSEADLKLAASDPREFWLQARKKGGHLTGYKKSALAELKKSLPLIEAGQVSEETLPEAERIWMDLDGTISTPAGQLPVKGRFETYVATSGLTYSFWLTDAKSFQNPQSEAMRGFASIAKQLRVYLASSPSAYMNLEGWDRQAMGESMDGAILVRADAESLGMITVYRISPSDFASSMKTYQHDPSFKQAATEAVEENARP